MWPMVRQAHGECRDAATTARAKLLARYGPPVQRYLLGALRDRDAAEELFQEFALRLVRGDFHAADASRGHFRNLLRTAAIRLVVDYKRKCRRNRSLSISDENLTVLDGDDKAAQQQFQAACVQDLFERTRQAMARHEPKLQVVLSIRTANPEGTSAEHARRLTELRGQPVAVKQFRVLLCQARQRFCDLFLDEVARTLADPTPDELERELVELGLVENFRKALDRRCASVLE